MNRLWPHLKDKKLVIFDYNGTILYDLEVCVEALNNLRLEQGMPALSAEYYRNTFYFPVKSFYADMGFDFTKISFEEISDKYYEFYNQNLHRCGVYDGFLDLVIELKHNGIKTAILTALNQQELFKQMPMFGIEGMFDAAFGLEDFHAHSKLERGRELMAHMNMAPEDIILVGDTTHDAEVAHELGIDVLLLDDGHQTTDRLQHKSATSMVSTKTSVVTLGRKYNQNSN